MLIIIESLNGWGWNGLKSPPSSNLLPWADCLLRHQAGQCPIQPGLERLQRRDIHSFSGQSMPVPCHSVSETFCPNIQPFF